MDLGLAGQVAFVTGASGGIGWAIAEGLAAEGARLALHAHRQTESLAARVGRSRFSDRACVVAADVRQRETVEAAFAEARERWGTIDICIVNAGIWEGASQALSEMSPQRIERTLAVNLWGAIWTARAFLRQVPRRTPDDGGKGASLLFVGSTAGRFGERGNADYAASKAALYGLVRTLKNEIVERDPRGRVNMVEPGWTLTAMTREALARPGAVEQTVATMPLRRIAVAEDIARAVVFLASPTAARHVTGEILTIAGGMEGRRLWDAGAIDGEAIRRQLAADDPTFSPES